MGKNLEFHDSIRILFKDYIYKSKYIMVLLISINLFLNCYFKKIIYLFLK